MLKPGKPRKDLYFHRHPLDWWTRFSDIADVSIYPWRSLTADIQKAVFPDNAFGSWLFGKLYDYEEKWPDFFARHMTYPMIVLVKRK